MWLQTPWPSTHPVLRASLSLLETASSSSRHEISSPFDMAVHCTVCPETFSSPRELKRHARTHGKEKLFECGICNKKFKSKGSLPNHLKTHTGEKPFECAICSKRFYQKVNLKMECPECLERFDSSEHRPKSLPCGHSFCLRCLRQLRVRTCPADSLVFQSSPEALPDNLIVLQACKKPVDNTLCRLWCRSCSMNATEDCVDEHSAAVCSLKKLRSERRLEAPAAPPVSRVADIAESASTEAPVPSRSTMPPLPSTHPSGSLVTTSEDCDLEADSQECSSLDAFPDELLLMILSELRDCELLLDVVPRVCSRWRALARDPRVWADIRVKPVNPVGAARNDPRAYLLPARTILRAPALRSLHFPWMFDMPLANDTLHSALRRCQAAVGELHLDNGGGVCSRVARRLGEGGRSALGCLLRRSGAALRALSLGDALLPELWSRRTSPFRSSDRPRIPVVLNALPGLTRLQDLSLRVHDMTRYHGQLAGGVLKLRRLCLAYHHTAGPAAFARDLVAGAADTLRSLELLPMDADSYLRVGLPAAVLEAVALCGGLESLHITLTDMAVVRAMPRLGTLRLLVPRDWYLSPDGFLASEVFVRVLGELKDCRPLAHLSRLELCTGPRSKSTPEKLPVDWDTFFSFEAEAVFRALGRLAAAATILHLRLSPFAPTLCMYDLLSGMYRVREVYLRPNDTVLKAALPELGVKLFRSE